MALTAGRGPLCLDMSVERNGSFYGVLSSTPARIAARGFLRSGSAHDLFWRPSIRGSSPARRRSKQRFPGAGLERSRSCGRSQDKEAPDISGSSVSLVLWTKRLSAWYVVLLWVVMAVTAIQ